MTKCTILCPTLPKCRNVALFQVDSYEKVLEVFKLAKTHLSEILSAFEFFDHDSREVIEENLKVKNPFEIPENFDPTQGLPNNQNTSLLKTNASNLPFYIVLETSGSNDIHDQEKLMNFIEITSEKETILNGILAENSQQIEYFWNLRERIAEAFNIDGYVFKYDLSMQVSELYTCVEALRNHINSHANQEDAAKIKRLNGYGHIGDGNLHINISCDEYDSGVEKILEPFIYNYVSKINGSVSAEHGLGFKKSKYIYLSKPENSVKIMKQIKNLLDPKGLMNPYKVLPEK